MAWQNDDPRFINIYDDMVFSAQTHQASEFGCYI